MRKDDLLHVVCHEEVIKSSTLIPLHEGFLRPRKNTVQIKAVNGDPERSDEYIATTYGSLEAM